MSSLDDEKIGSELKGNTLRVYWALLNSRDGVMGVRQLQRQLGFSSPTLAAYHLNKLENLELVVKERGDYRLVREVKVGVLKQFIKLGTFLLPRYIFYATFFTMLLIFLLTQLKEISFYSVFALMLGILSTVILWYETIRVWIQKP
ncbi:MAG: winged helix-turn-helix domain-containing protein [Candidatus Bathyarchaeia archaeon]